MKWGKSRKKEKGMEDGGMEGWRDGGRRDGWGCWRAGRLESKKKEIKPDVAVHVNIS